MLGGFVRLCGGRPWLRASRAAALALFVVLGLAPAASAEQTLGSALSDPFSTTFGGTGITVYQEAAPSESLVAPSAGTITAWSVRSADSGAEYELRILRPTAGGELTALSTSTPQKVTDGEDKVRGPFPVSMAVKAGDRIALYVVKGLGAPYAESLLDELNYVDDPYANGETRKPKLEPLHGGGQELLLAARFKAGGPVNTSPPLITGEPSVGSLLTATEGSWENASSFAYQWFRCLEPCEKITGATAATYTPTTPDEGKQLVVAVTATGEGGSTTAQSAPTDGVKPGPPPPPANTGLPQVSGEARETETLTGTIGNWAGGPTSFTEQWLRCATASGGNCAPIPGATSLTYVPVHADVGSTLRLSVTASNGIGPTSAQSAPTPIVQPLVLKAILTASPAGTFCTGIPVQFNGGASKTPNPPIVNYRFTYVEFPIQAGLLFIGGPEALEEYLASLPVHELASGRGPGTTATFTWNRIATEDDTSAPYLGQPWRDPILVTLTATDLAGATAKASVALVPGQYSAVQSRTNCPKVGIRLLPSLIASRVRIAVAGAAVSTRMSCKSTVPCAGSVTVLAARGPLALRAKRTPAKSKQLLLARTTFFSIGRKRSATVRAPLTHAGRTLLKRGRSVRAIVQLTSVSPAGSKSTRSIRVTLTRR